jgi:predicted  nucleic acid-binding Zn-ribbon protein
MAEQLDVLKRLQTIDAELYRLRRAQREKPLELEQAEAQLVAQETRVKAADDALKRLQVTQKEKEIDLQSREASVKKLQGQLFQVKTNKEYTAMQHEIETLKADNSLLEEEILKLFDAIEQATKERQRQSQELATQQARLKVERSRIEQELAAISDQIGELERDRGSLAQEAPPPALAVYERVLGIRDGLALVPIVESSCGGCHRRLPPQVVNEVYLKAELVTCEHCNRILYFDETHSKL